MKMIKPGMDHRMMRKIARPDMDLATRKVEGKLKRKMTQAEDDAYDKAYGIKEGSKRDIMQDRMNGIKDKKKKTYSVKDTGKFNGKSNALGHGGRAAQMRAQGASGALIGFLARRAGAAPGQANYHGSKSKKKAV